MYYCLNFFPVLLHIFVVILCNIQGIKINMLIYLFLLFIAMPVYLLIINAIYSKKAYITYLKCMCYMLSEVVINFIIMLVMQKIVNGDFIGDVPIGLYCLFLFVPMLNVIIGTVLLYIWSKRRR